MAPRIALVHAVAVAMEPVQDAFRRLWPDASCFNLLDDSLGPDRARGQGLSPALAKRIGVLADYAVSTGADGILFTCSAFGEAIEAAAVRLAVPVLKPNEAMFEAALRAGNSIGMVATFAPAVDGMEREFNELARRKGAASARIRTACVPDAMQALRAGDVDGHNRLVAAAAAGLAGCDAVMLAQFSTARAEQAAAAATSAPVLTSPGAAVRRLRQAIAGEAP